jgi:hypothetical protein
MKKLLIATSLLALTGCGYASPDAGQEGVLVRKPWFFGDGGVDPETVKTGSAVVAGSTDVIYIPVSPQAFDIGFNDLMPSNGIPLDFHTTVRVQVTDAAALVSKWNGAAKNDKDELSNAWFWSNIHPQYANFVRQEVKNYDMASLAFNGAVVDAIDQKVQNKLADFIKRNKMPVRLLGVTIGRASPPQAILNQRTETAAQQQREQTMIAQQKAEQARKGAELARAEADNAYRMQMQLSPEQYVQLKAIEMQRSACANGTCIFGNVTPMINTGK